MCVPKVNELNVDDTIRLQVGDDNCPRLRKPLSLGKSVNAPYHRLEWLEDTKDLPRKSR